VLKITIKEDLFSCVVPTIHGYTRKINENINNKLYFTPGQKVTKKGKK